MSLTTCPDCPHLANEHTTGRCLAARWTTDLCFRYCECQRGSVAVFLPADLDNLALRYAAARLELDAERHMPGNLADEKRGAARYLRGLAR